MTKHFADEHKKAFGTAPPKQGYPDAGNGRFMEKASYKEWFEFSLRQRAHGQFMEGLTVFLFANIIGGLFYIQYSLVIAAAMLFFRTIFVFGYTVKPELRQVGGIPITLMTYV
eukprot:CAMPEP_0205803224 /NCGR_PEP_ID=MMETSP0205-20121125/5812_1 /ASSEMBLY_ACC=CAM_ASM_000278 /TAXON_ID=36767 /ORGANISM="Euplotes focardii, Strain TN1" /LENGTH=112 /DNA_ID=CAMNT_0053070957 /DNA_START=55 /DNA_END=389 /DNA_ORIENTATION=+